MYKVSNIPISAECEQELRKPFPNHPDTDPRLYHPHVDYFLVSIERKPWMMPCRFDMIMQALLRCLELVLRITFSAPPDVSYAISSFTRVHENTVVESMEVKRWIILDWFEIIMRVLLSSSFLSALAAVLILRNYPRLRLLLNTVLGGSALAYDRARNRGRGAYQPGDASNGAVISNVSPGLGRPPTKSLRRRRLKKHSTYSQHLEDCKYGEG